MDQTMFFVLQSLVVGFVSIGILPNHLRLRRKGYKLVIIATFLAFFLLSLWHLLGRYDVLEAFMRALISGVIPIISAYLFVYFTKDYLPKK